VTLPEFWFLLIGFMFASYFVLEGFDFGSGLSFPSSVRTTPADGS
jgi:cytochrome d ubiquinol oxidase subunit II